MEMNAQGTVLIVDDQILLRKGLVNIINGSESFQVIAEASSCDEAFEQLAQRNPDIIVVDLELEGKSGLELVYELRRRKQSEKILVIGRRQPERIVSMIYESGAQGFICKNATVEDFFDALLAVQNRRPYIPPLYCHLPCGDGAQPKKPPSDPLDPLSTREREIFHLLASGLQNSEIAKQLFISPRTVETHRARVVRKLGLHSNAALIRYAIRHGLSVV